MNEFALCIEYLLLSHDCIVVPGLGAFIAQHQEARYDDSEETMLPPYRQVRFNAELQHQDSLITTSIQQIYGIQQSEAEKKLGMWVTDFLQNLEDCGSTDFGSIGVFTDDDEQISFTPAEAGITTQDFYALDAFHLQQIIADEETSSPIQETDKENIVIRINRQFVSYVAAACIAILLFLSFSTPVGNSDPITYGQHTTSELFVPTNLMISQPEKDVKQQEVNPTTEMTISEQPSTSSIQSPTPEVKEEKQDLPCYCIVVASAVSQKNAERYVEILKQRGFDSARILDNGRITRVVVGSYQTEEEAGVAVRQIHRQSEEYKYAWVIKP